MSQKVGDKCAINYYQITDNESRRINILKVWFSIIVVFIHSFSEGIRLGTGVVEYETSYWFEILKYTVSLCISRCAVPGFFMISAILLYRNSFSWGENIKKKIKTLLVPYMLINSVWIIIYFAGQHISKLSIYFLDENNIIADWGLADWLRAYGLLGGYPITYPLWFIRDLFILNIFAVVYKKIVEKMKWMSLLFIVLIWLFTKASWTQAVCFWGLGCFVVCNNIRLNVLDKIRKEILYIIYFSAIVGDILTRSYKVNLPIHNICIIIGIIFWFVCLTDFKTDRWNKILLFISSYSFSIYLFHELSLSLLQKICARLLPTSATAQLLEYLLIPIFIITGVLIFSLALKRVCPRLYGVITGNRGQ